MGKPRPYPSSEPAQVRTSSLGPPIDGFTPLLFPLLLKIQKLLIPLDYYDYLLLDDSFNNGGEDGGCSSITSASRNKLGIS